MYFVVFSPTFRQKYKTIVTQLATKKKVAKTLKLLAQNPDHPSLRTHKVVSRQFGEKWSSSVTGDLRIIWEYSPELQLTILVLALGGHAGRHRVY